MAKKMAKMDDCDWTLVVDKSDIRGLTLEERRRLGLCKNKNAANCFKSNGGTRNRQGSGGNYMSVGARVLRAMWSMRGAKNVNKMMMKRNVADMFEFGKSKEDMDIVPWKGKGKEISTLERGKRKAPNCQMKQHGEQEGRNDCIKRVASGVVREISEGHHPLNVEDEVLSCGSSSAIPDKGEVTTSRATSIVPYPLDVPDEVIPSNAGSEGMMALPDEVGPKLLPFSVNVEHDGGKEVQENLESDGEINAKDLDQLDQTVRFALAYLKPN